MPHVTKKPYKQRGRPEKNPKRLRIERLKNKGLYPSDAERRAESEAALTENKTKGVAT